MKWWEISGVAMVLWMGNPAMALETEAMRVAEIKVVQPVVPVVIRNEINPVIGFCIRTEGSTETKSLESVGLMLKGSGIESAEILTGIAEPPEKFGKRLGERMPITGGEMTVSGKLPLVPGENWFWLSVRLSPAADSDGVIDAAVCRLKVSGEEIGVPDGDPAGTQRIGTAVRLPGDDGVKAYRIPGLVRTTKGTLVGVYDIRHNNAADLPADIDVGVSRSTDGGRKWDPMRIAIDMGNDPKFAYDGVGDPCVFVDRVNGRIWIAALWSHGKRSWRGSEPGMTPEETGQLVLAYSDDDGKSWSKPRNITNEVKNPAWRLLLAGPGTGITRRDGTLVFPAQFRAADGTPFSTMIWSKDRGESWHIGTGVKTNTTEAQLVELTDGSIMINCRDDCGGSRTVAVTNDLGETWQPHSSDRKALPEPVCMASLLRVPAENGTARLFFSNPASTRARDTMTLKMSEDDGVTWPEKFHTLYDVRGGFGYSCLAPVDDGHLGILYEGSGGLYFLRIAIPESGAN
ncbi:MAG: exo-alpha-sialidase [Luteolibacter sp.]|uniref:exo-alpha-sialidase n=1 Tax=Luteolibacter sp. TaxID=1962973 RepID=UPI003266C75B